MLLLNAKTIMTDSGNIEQARLKKDEVERKMTETVCLLCEFVMLCPLIYRECKEQVQMVVTSKRLS